MHKVIIGDEILQYRSLDDLIFWLRLDKGIDLRESGVEDPAPYIECIGEAINDLDQLGVENVEEALEELKKLLDGLRISKENRARIASLFEKINHHINEDIIQYHTLAIGGLKEFY